MKYTLIISAVLLSGCNQTPEEREEYNRKQAEEFRSRSENQKYPLPRVVAEYDGVRLIAVVDAVRRNTVYFTTSGEVGHHYIKNQNHRAIGDVQ